MGSFKGIEDLPDEILVEVFSYLSLKDIVLSARHVNRHWGEVAQDSELWSRIGYYPDENISDTEIINILKQVPNLQTFIPKKYMKRGMLTVVIKHCKDIRSLEMYMDELNTDIIKELVVECKNIESLSIIEKECDASHYFKMIKHLMKLKSLKLCGTISDEMRCVFTPLADGCPSLQHFDLRHLYGYTNKDLQYFLNQKKDQLLSLYLKWNSETNKSTIPLLHCCTTLETLYIEEYCDVMTEKGFQMLQKLPPLRSLSLCYFRTANLSYMIDVFDKGDMSQLTLLDLRVYDNFENSLAQTIFRNCQKLKQLILLYCPNLTDNGLKNIDQLRELEHLNLCSCDKLTDAGMLHLAKCCKLKQLNLNGCPSISNESMKVFFNFKNLRVLQINACSVDIPTFLEIPNQLKNLKYLRLNDKKLKMGAVYRLKYDMPSLKVSVVKDLVDW